MKRLFFTAGFLLLNFMVFAQNYTAVINVDELKRNLKSAAGNRSSIQADFTQEKHLAILEAPVISTGKFYYQAEDKVRWEILSPEPYLVVINGSKMVVRDKMKTKTVDTRANRMYGKINEIMISSVKGTLGDDSRKYKTEYLESSSAYMMKLIPLEKGAKNYIAEIQIFFDKKTYDVNGMKMLEPGGDYTEIRFFNKTLNGTISPSVFTVD